MENWDCTFQDGIATENYVGDIFGSLGGKPDFGFGSITNEERVAPGGINRDLATREMDRRKQFSGNPPRKI